MRTLTIFMKYQNPISDSEQTYFFDGRDNYNAKFPTVPFERYSMLSRV